MTASEVRLPSLVSVVTPCFNAAPYVAETIASVRAQDYARIEHIVVDDGSEDESWQVTQSFRDSVTSIRLGRNHGGAYARNRGAELARGDFLMFLDADDVIHPATISALVAAATNRPGGIAICPWRRLVCHAGTWISQPAELPLPTPGTDALRGWLEGVWVPTCAVLWRRDTYNQTGGWDETLMLNDDGDLMLRALAEGAHLAMAAGGEGLYRVHPVTRLTVSGMGLHRQRLTSQVDILRRLAIRLDGKGLLAQYHEAIGIAYLRIASKAFRVGYLELGRNCMQLGEGLAGRRAVARTRIGRALERVVGVERKERMVKLLAKMGLASSQRRNLMMLQSLHGRARNLK
jgi:glycosyltransferase involved in cell wall biosynthesis